MWGTAVLESEIMENRDRKDEKLEAGELHLRRPATLREAREHGKLYRWFDNFWYHHKWKTVASLFIVLVLLVGVLQMCGKEPSGDVAIVTAGPYGFTADEAGLSALRACLSTYLPADYDGDGERKVDVNSFTVYSEEQIKALAAQRDENGDPAPVNINTYQNSQTYTQYNNFMMTGECSILFLDPWLFAEMAKKSEYLVDLSANFGEIPAGTVMGTDEDGTVCPLGVRLGDTALYRENIAMKVLPADTIICLMGPYFAGKSSDEALYARSVELFSALVDAKKVQ